MNHCAPYSNTVTYYIQAFELVTPYMHPSKCDTESIPSSDGPVYQIDS